MKKIKLLKENELKVTKEHSIGCDFCGESKATVFTSDYDECDNTHKCEMQICVDCVSQLYKLI